jgi:transcriptional regulator with XRE-family HTH domain
MRFGEWLKAKREAVGMQVGELAEKAGVNRGTIWRIEKGENATTEVMERLAVALGAEATEALEPSDATPTEAA